MPFFFRADSMAPFEELLETANKQANYSKAHDPLEDRTLKLGIRSMIEYGLSRYVLDLGAATGIRLYAGA